MPLVFAIVIGASAATDAACAVIVFCAAPTDASSDADSSSVWLVKVTETARSFRGSDLMPVVSDRVDHEHQESSAEVPDPVRQPFVIPLLIPEQLTDRPPPATG